MNKKFSIKPLDVSKVINKIAAKAEVATKFHFLSNGPCCAKWDLSEPTSSFTAVTL